MTLKHCLITLILAGLSATGLAQTGSLNCQGLVGGAMALCLQGQGPERAVPATPRQETRAPTSSESARPGTEARAGANDTGKSGGGRWSLLDWLGFDGSSFGGSSGRCEGLVGGAMSRCMQDIGTASGNSGNTASSRQGSATTNTESARSSLDSVPRNFSIGSGSLNCQGLVGGAMAQCLQGNEPAPRRSGSAAPR